MAGAMARIPMSHRIFTYDARQVEFSDELAMSLSDTVFGFLHEQEGEGSPESIIYNGYNENEGHNEDEEERENSGSIVEDNKSFWDNQHQLLQAALYRTSCLESRISNCTKEALRETGNVCTCQKPVFSGCRNCLMKRVSSCLQNAGFNSAICKSKWKSLPDIPSGEHSFVDVVDNSKKIGEVRVIIELNFRGEFEMARASEEYNQLISKLPEVFIGKVESLVSLVKILCSAAKKCMKEKKMHMGPWRKHKYMEAKWLKISERKAASRQPLSTAAEYSSRMRPRASMLTVDLLEKLPSLHCHAAVEVL